MHYQRDSGSRWPEAQLGNRYWCLSEKGMGRFNHLRFCGRYQHPNPSRQTEVLMIESLHRKRARHRYKVCCAGRS